MFFCEVWCSNLKCIAHDSITVKFENVILLGVARVEFSSCNKGHFLDRSIEYRFLLIINIRLHVSVWCTVTHTIKVV